MEVVCQFCSECDVYIGLQLCESNGTNTPHYHPPDEATERHIVTQLGDIAGLGALKELATHAR